MLVFPAAPVSGGSGPLSLSEHDALFSLAHKVPHTADTELVYTGQDLTRVTIWTDVSRTLKRRESTFTYSSGRLATATIIQFNDSGAAVGTLTKTFTYTGVDLTDVSTIRS